MKRYFGSLSFYRQALMMYGVLKLTDIVKIIVAHLWLKKEKWVKNLTAQAT